MTTAGTDEGIGPPPLRVQVITPHSGLDAFRDAVGSLTNGFTQARHLAWRFFLRDTRAQHRQSLLGYVWLILPPLANTLVWVFLTGQQVVRIDTAPVPYPLFVLCGTILWTAFNGSMMSMLGVVNDARGVLAKVNFPHEALVYSALSKAALDGAVASLLLVPALFLFHVSLPATLPLFLVALAAAILIGAAIGLVVVPVAALYTDLSRAIQLGMRFLFFLTPVVYQLPTDGVARLFMLLNPITPVLISGRAWLTGSGDALTVHFTGVLLAGLLVFGGALVMYKVALPHLIERLSA